MAFENKLAIPHSKLTALQTGLGSFWASENEVAETIELANQGQASFCVSDSDCHGMALITIGNAKEIDPMDRFLGFYADRKFLRALICNLQSALASMTDEESDE